MRSRSVRNNAWLLCPSHPSIPSLCPAQAAAAGRDALRLEFTMPDGCSHAAETRAPTAAAEGGRRTAGKRCRNSSAASFVQHLQCYKTSAQHTESALSCVKSQNIGNLLRLHTHVVAVTSRSSL